MQNLRASAARVLFQVVFRGNSLADCLPQAMPAIPEARDQALVKAICFGVCRRFFTLQFLVNQLLDKKLKDKDGDIFCLLLVGLYQLTDMRVAPHAAVSETVDAVTDLQKPWAKNLVNAVLRNYQRHAEELISLGEKDEEALYAHPAWFIGKIKKSWPDHYKNILHANNVPPPFSLRVNQRQQKRADYLQLLAAENIEGSVIPETGTGIILSQAMNVEQLPAFANGGVSVQDGAAQLAAELLQLAPGQRVLDACAAPGGKTAHIAECEPALSELVAVEKDAVRLTLVSSNLERLGLTATCIAADAAETAQWWDGKQFDRILLDAPCTASGVIRRHPDIKILRRPEDIAALADEQWRILSALWPLLAVDGLLLYSTCSVFPQENTQLIERFLAQQADAEESKIEVSWGEEMPAGRQILPGAHGMDGFYYARLHKRTN
jgi:16S rRNA (cytosine967-C5)-methyltransferase